jgi:hypothetical protein
MSHNQSRIDRTTHSNTAINNWCPIEYRGQLLLVEGTGLLKKSKILIGLEVFDY